MAKISLTELISTSIASVLLESCIKDIGTMVSFVF